MNSVIQSYFTKIYDYTIWRSQTDSPSKDDQEVIEVADVFSELEAELYEITQGLDGKWAWSINTGNYSYVPWICFLPPGQKVSNGIYVAICFGRDGNGAVAGCAISASTKLNVTTVERTNPAVNVNGSSPRTRYNDKFVTPHEIVRGEEGKVDLNTIIRQAYKKAIELINKSPVLNKRLTDQSQTFPKPFLILAGSSGTGKSRWVRKQAYNTWPRERENTDKDTTPPNYQIIAVRPNWHDSSEVLGYITRVSGVRYVVTDFIRFLIQAWKQWAKERAEFKDESSTPFYLCLDEMNLAPVEQYFAEYLSVVESRRVAEVDAFGDEIPVQGYVISDALIPKGEFEKLASDPWAEFCKDAGIDLASPVANMLKSHGLTLPPNLYVVGTVNMDETTHSFSRKVLDRAFVWEMPIGNLMLDSTLSGADRLAYPENPASIVLPQATEAYHVYDPENELQNKMLEWLVEVNYTLAETPFQVSYRVRDELLLLMAVRGVKDEAELWQCLDDGLYSKILPRIEGDEVRTCKALSFLARMLIEKSEDLPNSWKELKDALEHGIPFEALRNAPVDNSFWGEERPSDPFAPVQPWRRSLAKIRSMLLKLEGQFTSFWD